jgi:transcription elongation factor Elf1
MYVMAVFAVCGCCRQSCVVSGVSLGSTHVGFCHYYQALVDEGLTDRLVGKDDDDDDDDDDNEGEDDDEDDDLVLHTTCGV